MIQNNDLKSFNVFASETAGYYDETYKDNPQYAAGHEPLQSLPATWYNTLMRDLTQQAQTTKNVVDSIYAELKSVIVEGGQTLSSSDTQQLLKAINKITELQIATGTILGGIYSSAANWFVSVQPDGTAKVNTVDSSTTTKGLVQLNNTLTSTSTTQALTAAQGKALKDAADTLSTTVSNLSTNLSTNYKPKQTAVSDPTASTTATTINAIDSISQDANGVITATKKPIRAASTTQSGVVQLSNSYNTDGQTRAVTEKALKDGLATKQVSGNYKTEQVAIASTPLSTDAVTDAFIDTLGQNSNGVILATRRKVVSAAVGQKGIVELSNSYSGDSTSKAVTEKALKDGLATKQVSGNYKTTQTAVSDPTPDGSTAVAFIDSISQDTNGVITATKKSIRNASSAQSGIVQLSNSYSGDSTSKAVTEWALSEGLATKQAAGNYKTTQTAVSDPTASTTATTINAIDSISQDANGVITATKKPIRAASTTQSGIVQLSNSYSRDSTSKAVTEWALSEGLATKQAAGNYKPKQAAVENPTDVTNSALDFIHSISQDTNGVISATRRQVRAASTTQSGVVKLNNTLTSTSTTQALTAAQGKALKTAIDNVSTDLSNYKPKQEAVSDPTASTTAATINAIDSISQDTNGVITATKKPIREASTTQSGVVKLSNSYTGTSQTMAVTEKALSDGLKAAGHTYALLNFSNAYQHYCSVNSSQLSRFVFTISDSVKIKAAIVTAEAYGGLTTNATRGCASFLIGEVDRDFSRNIFLSESTVHNLPHTISFNAYANDYDVADDGMSIIQEIKVVTRFTSIQSSTSYDGSNVVYHISLLVEDCPANITDRSSVATATSTDTGSEAGIIAYLAANPVDIYAKSVTLI